MSAPLLTLSLAPHYSVIRDIILPRLSTPLGAGVMQVRRRYARPVYRFTVQDRQAIQADAEQLYSFMQYHGPDIPFWWSGGPWGTPSTALLFGVGDGARTEFELNNRHITADTLTLYVDGVETSGTVDLAPGLVTFASAPLGGALLTATYSCTYKVVFWYDQDVMQREDNFMDQLFKYEGIQLYEQVP